MIDPVPWGEAEADREGWVVVVDLDDWPGSELSDEELDVAYNVRRKAGPCASSGSAWGTFLASNCWSMDSLDVVFDGG